MMKKIFATCTSFLALLILSVMPAFAHAIVYPHQVGIAAIQDFTLNVPNEKDNPVVSIRLVIPNDLSSVIPYVAPGWTISTKTSGSGDNATITEINWTGGSIPIGQAEEFRFQAQAPAKSTILNWKAYQTYSDGTQVSWDINPAIMKNMSDGQQDAMADKENKGVYSTTQVVDDVTNTFANQSTSQTTPSTALLSEVLAGAAFVCSVIALCISLVKRK